ncbi:hypothetical protein D3C76_1289880 [compost metagenome]
MAGVQIPAVAVPDNRAAEHDTLDLDISEPRQDVANDVGAKAVRDDHNPSGWLHCLSIAELLHHIVDGG